MMNRATGATLILCVAAGAIAREPTEADFIAERTTVERIIDNEAVEILEKVDAATKAVRLVSYSFTFKGTGSLEARTPVVAGAAVLGGESPSGLDKFRFEIMARQPDSTDSRSLVAGSDGSVRFLIDPQTMKAHENIDPAVFGSDRRLIARIPMREFTHPTPFSDEINGDIILLKGTAKVGDEECHEIHVKYSTGPQEAVWYFSKKDYLPRRVDRTFANPPDQQGGTQLLLLDLAVDPKFERDPFRMVVPGGFEKTDELAPNHGTLAPVLRPATLGNGHGRRDNRGLA